jgi:hypothetical protein
MQAITKTAARLIPSHMPVSPALVALAQFAAQRPGLEFGNYCSGWNDADGRRAYFSEARSISRQLADVRAGLRKCAAVSVTDDDVRQACRRAFGGRLQLDESGRVDYCTGQYFPTEYRRAVAAVLDSASTIAYDRAVAATR